LNSTARGGVGSVFFHTLVFLGDLRELFSAPESIAKLYGIFQVLDGLLRLPVVLEVLGFLKVLLALLKRFRVKRQL
jgi:hypothetical protein